jgi:hypothetical protein
MHSEDSTTEEWRPIPGWRGYYEVSSMGRVRSLPREVKSKRTGTVHINGRMLKPATKPTGHKHVGLSMGGSMAVLQVHALVLLAFFRPKNPGEVCRHVNGNPGDNRLQNLTWGTSAENAADMVRHGRSAAKLSPEQVHKIRKSTDTDTDEAAKHGVSRTCISAVRNGRTYRWVK